MPEAWSTFAIVSSVHVTLATPLLSVVLLETSMEPPLCSKVHEIGTPATPRPFRSTASEAKS